jgi:hypothetical protein
MAALGRKNSGLSMHHNHDNKDVAAPIPGFQIVIFPRFVGNSDALCFALFCKSRAGRPAPGSIDRLNCGQFGAISSEICGFLSQRCKRPCARNSPPGRFFGLQLKPRAPSWSRGGSADATFSNTSLCGGGDRRRAPLAHRFYGAPYQLAPASFVQKQSPACAAGLFIGAETTRYFTEATFPNWLSNGL